jgi:hypothetical protein
VRLSKFKVVACALACVLMAGAAQAQFGKLKSIAKDKLGMQPKGDQAAAAGPSAGAGEAKATYAPGVKKTVNVTRHSDGTPEAKTVIKTGANTSDTVSGGLQVVTLKVSSVDARQFDSVQANNPCNKLSNFQILSATQMKVTIDISQNKSDRTCSLYFKSGGNVVFSATVPIHGKK